MKINQKIKYVSIVIFSSILSVVLHAVTSDSITGPQNTSWSVCVKLMGLPVVVTLYFLITFGSIAYIFYKYENKLIGRKGLRYGIAIGLLWLWGMIESVSLLGSTYKNELMVGICDAVPIALMSLLLGIFTAKNKNIKIREKFINFYKLFITILTFSIIFLGRYIFYYTNILGSGYKLRPYSTFIWTLFMGTIIGISYLLLGKATKASSSFLSAIKFGVIIFGVNWLAFNMFIPFIFKGTFFECITRTICDILLVTLSCYVTETLFKNKHFQDVSL